MTLEQWAQAENQKRHEAFRGARIYQLALEAEGQRWRMEHQRESHARLKHREGS